MLVSMPVFKTSDYKIITSHERLQLKMLPAWH